MPHSIKTLGQKKKIVMLPSPDQNLQIGSVGRDVRANRQMFFEP